jgi:hypothetical protein
VLILGLIVATVLILVRIIWGSPLVTRVRESFAGTMINSITECPPGIQMYMYEGAAYCCSGKVDTDAAEVAQTCRAPFPKPGDPPMTFCTLGPSQGSIKNCLELRSGLLQAEGEALCPAFMPNYVKNGSEPGRCCKGPANESLTDCAAAADVHCDVITDSNFFANPQSCQFLRAQQDDAACPKGYHRFSSEAPPAMTAQTPGMRLFGCTDSTTNCYSKATLARLRELKYDVSMLKAC